ncbi:MAG: DUF5711 family protein [Bacillota bacterium]|nr:DUF5711 family protein [Bacillota bacterium]
MKSKIFSLILVCTLFLSACSAADESFCMDTYGETFSTGNAIFCMGNKEISAYDLEGEKICTLENTLAEPYTATAGSYAVIYGEAEIFLSDGNEIRHNLINNKIMSTAINKNGYAAVCTEEAGYKGSATVYDENFSPIYKWYCASGFIIKAALSEKNILAVLTANEMGSTVHVFELDSEKEQYSVFIEKTLAIDFAWLEEKLCIISENAAYFADEDGIAKAVDFDRTLGEYAFGDGFVLIEMLNGDGTSRLICYGKNGGKKGSAECEILRMAVAADDRIAVISGGEALLYDDGLNEICRRDARGVRNVMLCGGKLLLSRDSEIVIINE